MSLKCPNINDSNWKRLIEVFGEEKTLKLYISNGEEIPSTEVVDQLVGETFKEPKDIDLSPTMVSTKKGFDRNRLQEEFKSDNIGLIAPGEMNAVQEREIVKYLTVNILSDIHEHGLTEAESIESFLATFEEGAEEGNPSHTTIVKHWDAILKAVQIERITIGKLFGEEETKDDDTGEGNENNDPSYDDTSINVDHNRKVTEKLKRLFYSIPDTTGEIVDGNPVIKTTWFGMSAIKDLDETMNTLQQILVGIEPEYSAMKSRLSDYKEAYPWIDYIIDHLEGEFIKRRTEADDTLGAEQKKDAIKEFKKTEWRIKNEFTTWANKHLVNQQMILWDYKADTKEWIIRPTYVNRNSNSGKIIDTWREKLKQTDIVTVNDNGDLIMDSVKTKAKADEYDSLVKLYSEDKEKFIPEFANWLNSLGIDIDQILLRKLIDYTDSGKSRIYFGSYKQGKKGTFKQQLEDAGGIFKEIRKKLEEKQSDADNLLTVGNPLEDNSGIRKLVSYVALYSPQYVSNSFYDGDKTIWSYSVKKYYTDQTGRLKEDGDYVDHLLTKTFQGSSYVLSYLTTQKNGIAFKESFRDHFDYQYVSSIKRNRGRRAKQVDELTLPELERYRMSFFFNQGAIDSTSGQRRTKHIGLTMSDKKRLFVMNMLAFTPKANFDSTGFIKSIDDPETIDRIRKIIKAEYIRIYDWQSTLTNEQKLQYPENYDGGAELFFLFPELNDKTRDIWDKTGKLKPYENIQESLTLYVQNFLMDSINRKVQEWTKLGITNTENEALYTDKSYMRNIINPNISGLDKMLDFSRNRAKMQLMALDYEYNQMINNYEMYALYASDPAYYFKSNVDETLINIGKRLAGLNAPGEHLANTQQKDIAKLQGHNYLQLFAKDNKTTSNTIDYLEATLGKEGAASYRKIEATDAQEYTTIKEAVYVLFHKGKLDDSKYLDLISRIDKEGDNLVLSKEELDIILQIEKPVHYGLYDNVNGEMPVYIKTASMPLIPQFTKNLQINVLRKKMESMEKTPQGWRPVRMVFKSGTKVGMPKGATTLYDDNGNIDVTQLEKMPSRVLNRDNFRIQQEVPYDPDKDSINRGTQVIKLLFTNLSGRYPKFTELENRYNKTLTELYKLGLNDLHKEILVDGKLDIKKLQELLIEQANELKWPKKDIAALKIVDGKFDIPLFLNNSSDKIESLLLSIVDKRVRKQKMPGFSGPLASEAGIRTLEDIENTNGIVLLNGVDLKNGLKGQRLEDGVIKGAQVLVPFKFRDNDGNLLNIKEYVKDGKIDTTKLPKELLQLFGFRIPSQLHASMSYIEIVGFLPESMGDTIIAPQDFTKQMGSDFDVDKLYSYMYNTFMREDGSLAKYKGKDTKRNLQNDLLDIHLEVVKSEEAQPLILQALGFGDLHKLAEKTAPFNRVTSKSALQSTYQNDKYIGGRKGKAAVGSFSVTNTFNSALIRSNTKWRGLKNEELFIEFSGRKGTSLNDPLTNSGQYKSVVHAAFQSAAVDEEKEAIFYRTGISNLHYDFIGGMIQAGHDEDIIIAMIQQPIIKEFLDKVSETKNSLNPNRQKGLKIADIAMELFVKYGGKNVDTILEDFNPSISDLWKAMEKSKTSETFNETQVVALSRFMLADSLGKKLRGIASASSTDSSGLPKNFFESTEKESKLRQLKYSEELENIDSILDGTLRGAATENVLYEVNRLFKPLYPIDSDTFRSVWAEIKDISDKDYAEMSLGTISEAKKSIWRNFMGYLQMGAYVKVTGIDVNSERKRLFLDSKTNQSVATKLLDYKKKTNNPFLIRLEVVVDPTGVVPSTVSYDSSVGESLDSSAIYQAFNDLLLSDKEIEEGYTESDLAQDLIAMHYLSGSQNHPKSYSKFIPDAYLRVIGMNKELNSIDMNDPSILNMTMPKYPGVSYFTKEYFQNNPDAADVIDKGEINAITVAKKGKETIATEFKLKNAETHTRYVDRAMKPKEFLTMDSGGRIGKRRLYNLYQYNASTASYHLIPTKGLGSLFQEWSQGNDTSAIEGNNASANLVVKTDTVDNFVREAGVYENDLAVKQNGYEAIGLEVKKYDHQELGNIMVSVSTSPLASHDQQLVSKMISKALKTLPLQLQLTVGRLDKSISGYYSSNEGTIYMNSELPVSSTRALDVLIHETIHGVTSNAIKQFFEVKNFKLKLTDKQKLAILKLDGLRERVLKMLEKGSLESLGYYYSEYQEFLKQFKDSKLRSKDFARLRDTYYGLYNTEEFVTMSMTTKEFQHLLNQIDDRGQTLLTKFIDYVTEFLKAFFDGNVREGSILESAIQSSIELATGYSSDTISDWDFNIEDYDIEHDIDELPASMDMSPKEYINKIMKPFIHKSGIVKKHSYVDAMKAAHEYNYAHRFGIIDIKKVSKEGYGMMGAYEVKINQEPSPYPSQTFTGSVDAFFKRLEPDLRNRLLDYMSVGLIRIDCN